MEQRSNNEVTGENVGGGENLNSEPQPLIEENEDAYDELVVADMTTTSPLNSTTTTTTTTMNISSMATLPRPVATVKKSHSTLSSDLKRRFLKFTKDKSS